MGAVNDASHTMIFEKFAYRLHAAKNMLYTDIEIYDVFVNKCIVELLELLAKICNVIILNIVFETLICMLN